MCYWLWVFDLFFPFIFYSLWRYIYSFIDSFIDLNICLPSCVMLHINYWGQPIHPLSFFSVTLTGNDLTQREWITPSDNSPLSPKFRDLRSHGGVRLCVYEMCVRTVSDQLLLMDILSDSCICVSISVVCQACMTVCVCLYVLFLSVCVYTCIHLGRHFWLSVYVAFKYVWACQGCARN